MGHIFIPNVILLCHPLYSLLLLSHWVIYYEGNWTNICVDISKCNWAFDLSLSWIHQKTVSVVAPLGAGFLELANTNTGHTGNFECHINNKYFSSVSMSNEIFVFYLTLPPGTGLIHLQERALADEKEVVS